MPFTPSHIAAVIPLMSSATPRRYLDPWALAFGSMAPDLPLFLPDGVADYATWHSPLGVVCCAAPAALAMLALFQTFFRDPLTALLPPGLAGRVASLPAPRWRRLPALAAGAGLLTGVIWPHVTLGSYSASWPVVIAKIGTGGVVGCFLALTAYAAGRHASWIVTAAPQ